MKQFWIIVIQCVIFDKIIQANAVDLTFPQNFSIGVGSSSYQVEGAWNVSDKGEGIWDRYTHVNPAGIRDGNNGDISSNSYYQYKEDVQLIKSLGVDVYRFSPSWSRILPTGFTNVISEEGLQYYKNLTAELVANDIQPYVTIYHFDHPQIIEDMGGWTNELIVDWYVAYARILFEALGNSVKIWTTINEPETFCRFGYEKTFYTSAPGKSLNGFGKYLCGHNALKAHAKAYHMYDQEFRPTQHGQIGLVSACTTHVPVNASDTVTAETAFQFFCGWMAHPIYIGDYPEIIKTRLALVSEWQGYPTSRLPQFSKEWISFIKGTSDFYGLTHYTTILAAPDPDELQGIHNTDEGFVEFANENWPSLTVSGMKIYPPGLRYALGQIKDAYNNPPVMIMENGVADVGGLNDYDRIKYLHDYIEQMLIAIKEDGCNVVSYCVWSLLDSFEWASGYTDKYGLFSIDFDDPLRNRTAKLSASWFTQVLATRELQPVPTQSDC